MKINYIITAFFSTALLSNAANILIANSNFQDDAHNSSVVTSWTETAGDVRAFNDGAGVNDRVLIGQGASSAYTVTHVGLGTAIADDTLYTLNFEYGTVASTTTGTGVWTVELGTINGGTFTSLQTKDVTDGPGVNLRWSSETEGTDTLTFTTGTGTSGDDLSIRLSINGTQQFMAFDKLSLDATPVPEPSSTALLGLTSLALILRRKK